MTSRAESLWTARVNPRSSVRRGSTIDLAVDTSALYWFDPASGQAIARTGRRRPARLNPTMRYWK